MRVVADSNIYISAFNFSGPPSRVLELAQEGVIDLFISQPILEEIERVLARKRFNWPQQQVKEVLDNIGRFTSWILPDHFPTPVTKEDPSDDRILECAVAAQAQVIVTGDKHLLRLKHFQDIPIITPRQFLDTEPWKRG